ncbi:MAG TPA: hypothetical protein VHH73_12595, partial [Verrucomicrobiae bacterium]|nr:hypothetical protein [Verrucomicrobiae bacterium]
MPALDDIRKAIEQKIKPDQSLTLAVADVSYSDELMAFFKTLPAQTLNLGQAALSPPGSATQFQLTGAVKDTWTVLGVSNGNLAGVGLSLTCSQASPSAPIVTTLQVTKAQLALTSQSPVTLTGTLDSQAQLVLQNSPPTTARYGLDELYSFVGQTNFASDLVLKLFGNFGISSLSLTAKLGSGGLTDLGIQTSQDVQCQFLATPSIRLKSVGVELGFTVAPSAKGESVSSFSSRFSAQITLIGDYQVAFFQIKSGLWQMEVTPASGQLLPAIADLAQWAGGDT